MYRVSQNEGYTFILLIFQLQKPQELIQEYLCLYIRQEWFSIVIVVFVVVGLNVAHVVVVTVIGLVVAKLSSSWPD